MGLKVAISNIAWKEDDDEAVYEYLKKNNIPAIEIAPTRLFGSEPYKDLERARQYRNSIKNKFNLDICSLQSIWYGRTEKMFGTFEERQRLLDYTKNAIIFAEAVGANNLVFGCPRNRNIDSNYDKDVELYFFRSIGNYAFQHGTVIAMEANPKIYGTNYINTTNDAIELVHKVNSPGFKLNLDFGTIVENKEDICFLLKNTEIINHVHISEPNLNKIISRYEHEKLISILVENNYNGYISIEMSKQDDLKDVFDTIQYLKKLREMYYE